MAVVIVLAVGVTIALPLTSSRAASASGWSYVNSPGTSDGGDDVLLGATCANAEECWAVGVDIPSGGNGAMPLVQEWDGRNWSLVATPTASANGEAFFDVSCANSSDCWAVGTSLAGNGNPSAPLTELWDGTSWSVVPTPDVTGAAGAILRSVSCVSASDCWAVGETTDDTGTALGSIALHWDGTSWTAVATAPTGQTYEQLNDVTCVATDDCWAVGAAGPNQQMANFLPIFPGAAEDQGLIEHWNGGGWTIVASATAPPPDGGWISSVTCVNADHCWAAGSSTGTDGTQNGTLMQFWNGSAWSVVPTPDASSSGILSSVTCLSADRCWAAGSTGSIANAQNDPPNPSIEEWDGSTWSIQSSPQVSALAFLDSVTCVRGDACWAVGSSATDLGANNLALASVVEQMVFPAQGTQGFVAASSDGGVYNFGAFPFLGSMSGARLARPVVGIAATPDDDGYWEVAADGGIFSFGDAGFFGSMGGHPLDAPVVGMATTPDGQGYWEVAADGGIFSFGDADFFGSMGGTRLNEPIVGMVAAPDGQGYWEVAADGGIFAFGSADFFGSMGGAPLGKPIVGMVATPNGQGYWEVAADGGVFAFGNAAFFGSVPAQGIRATTPVTGMVATPDGGGYWLLGADGATYTYGDATFLGSLAGIRLAAPVVGASS
jgi:hypothetical protein